jgi:hypothetical protein
MNRPKRTPNELPAFAVPGVVTLYLSPELGKIPSSAQEGRQSIAEIRLGKEFFAQLTVIRIICRTTGRTSDEEVLKRLNCFLEHTLIAGHATLLAELDRR